MALDGRGAWPRRAEQRHGAEHVSGRACAGTGVLLSLIHISSAARRAPLSRSLQARFTRSLSRLAITSVMAHTLLF